MQLNIYQIHVVDNVQPEETQRFYSVKTELVAVCDSFSSLLWDVRYYECGRFEVYIAANARNVDIFRTGRIVAREDDQDNYGIIESLELKTDAENGDYLTVSGRFLMCLLERRIIYPTWSCAGKATSYSDIVRAVVFSNAFGSKEREIPSLGFDGASSRWQNMTTKLQVSYENLMEFVYTLCKTIDGGARISLRGDWGGFGDLNLQLYQGRDRSVLQSENPRIIFSDTYSNLLAFTQKEDASVMRNYAYILGQGEGEARKRTTWHNGTETVGFDRYELYVDADDISQEEGQTDAEYLEALRERGKQKLQDSLLVSESETVADDRQYVYQKDYYVGDYVTVQNTKFGLIQPKIQLTGMIESFDQDGRKLTPTFTLREEIV